MKTRPATWKMVSYITAMIVIIQFAGDNFLPSLPAIAQYFQVSKNLTQYSVTLYLLSSALFQFFYGPLSDILGRKKTIVAGYAIFTVGSIFCFCASSIFWLLLGRVIQGMGIACTGIFRSVMRDLYQGKDFAKIGSIITIAGTMTPPLAPITGGYLEHYFGWRGSFVLLFIMGIASVILFSRYFPESLAKEQRHVFSFKKVIKNYLECFSHRNFVIFSTCSGLCLGLLFGYMAIGTFLFQHVLGLSPVAYGWLSIFGVCFMPLGAFLNRCLMDKCSLYALSIYAALIMLIGACCVTGFSLFHVMTISAILVPTFIIYMGIGFIFTNSFTLAFQDFGHIAGVASAAYGVIQILTASALTALSAVLPATTQLPLGLFFIFCSTSLLVILTLVKPVLP